MSRPFPNADLKKLCPTREERGDLHGYLDLWLGEVAGYSCMPNRLHRRTRAELEKAQVFLSSSFFERYPRFADLADKIQPDTMPDLHYDLMLADRNRSDLLALIAGILQDQSK